MSEEQAKTEENTEQKAADAPAADAAASEEPQAEEKKAGPKEMKPRLGVDKEKYSKRTLRALARKWLKKTLKEDKEFAKGYFDAKSKRSTEKKLAFRKRHSAK